jgi:hypothetical protein
MTTNGIAQRQFEFNLTKAYVRIKDGGTKMMVYLNTDDPM